MNIAILAAGAGDMYCGSCMRDNSLASSLKRLGHNVSLIPLYTPLRSEADDASIGQIFYGGVNVYLQHLTALFRHTPRFFDWIFDRPWLLKIAGNLGAQTPPDKVADLTADVIEGGDGPLRKELRRLLVFLQQVQPQIVSLPNLMFVGMAGAIRKELNIPVVCELTGEDIFLDAMATADRLRLRDSIRRRAADVTRFVSASSYYAGRMAEYLDIPASRIDIVPMGLSQEYFTPLKNRPPNAQPPAVGYMARICPEKGLDRLVDAMTLLRQKSDFASVRLIAGGYLGARDQKWFDDLRQRIEAGPLRDGFTFLGEVDRADKIAMLDSVDLMSVPTAYPEAKGIYILEALARGVPVVQPEHGSFPELISQTHGGVLVPPHDSAALADAIASLLADPPRRQQLGNSGRLAVETDFTEDKMAARMVKIYEALL